ncbi:MAG: hypothetical protein B6A08_16185 [Sorangiineae bacterium NIC37A_2]|nr:MAG: hypothetical protein B6A08_16185 [Sorangiineae bacterium NIC37A_2]
MGEVLGTIAHDLRNPLAALLSNVGYLGMVSRDLPEDIRETIVDIELSVEALGRMTLAVALLGAELTGVDTARGGVHSAEKLLDLVWPQAERAAQSHGVGLRRGPSAKGSCAATEPHAQTALSALVHNAIACCPTGQFVTVSLEARDGTMVFSVEDPGPVLAPEFRESAFTMAGQTTTKGRLDGRYSRGLGLYVAGRSASLAGGTISVVEAPSGNCFELSFPVSR